MVADGHPGSSQKGLIEDAHILTVSLCPKEQSLQVYYVLDD
jgi:hypothetical protein